MAFLLKWSFCFIDLWQIVKDQSVNFQYIKYMLLTFAIFWTFWSLITLLFVENIQSRISTIVIRGSTDSIMDEISRAIDDGVNTYKALSQVWFFPLFLSLFFSLLYWLWLTMYISLYPQDGRLVPGAGATEIELAKQIAKYGEVIKKFSMLFCF